MNKTEAGTVLARLHADLLPCATGIRQRLSASEKYIIGFKDSSTEFLKFMEVFHRKHQDSPTADQMPASQADIAAPQKASHANAAVVLTRPPWNDVSY